MGKKQQWTNGWRLNMTGFKFRPATREDSPLLMGLIGASGSGKTKSALRLAEGIVSVRGGKIVGIDTEAKRMLHYAKEHIFQYLEFKPPHSSERYMQALIAAAEEAQGGCVIVDSMSHEHEGEGGYLEFAESEVERFQAMSQKTVSEKDMRKWIKPAQHRRRLINKLLQLNCAFIFCFRAKEKIKPVPFKEPIQLGWQPIAGQEFHFEMTANCLLLPGAKGVPDWSDDAFKHGAAKLPSSIEGILRKDRVLDEKCGAEMAAWAKGSSVANVAPAQSARKITEEELLEMKMQISSATSMDELSSLFSATYKKAKLINDEFAITQITQVKDDVKARLSTNTQAMTFAEVNDLLVKAKTLTEVSAAGQFIARVKDEKQREELDQIELKRMDELSAQ
jgi:ABC-type oligopeptide transport system ATPase subunit